MDRMYLLRCSLLTKHLLQLLTWQVYVLMPFFDLSSLRAYTGFPEETGTLHPRDFFVRFGTGVGKLTSWCLLRRGGGSRAWVKLDQLSGR
jgi:hypothetical protein